MKRTQVELDAGLKASEARHIGKITPQDIGHVMRRVAEEIRMPGALTSEGMSLTADGKSCSVYSPEAKQHDLFGWVVRLSFEHWARLRNGRKNIGDLVAKYIDSHIRTVSGGKLRLMTLGDTGWKYASQYLVQAAGHLHHFNLPELYAYAKDWESEEDKRARLMRGRNRKGGRLPEKPLEPKKHPMVLDDSAELSTA